MMPTILDYAGVSIPENVDGVSLKPLLDGKLKRERTQRYFKYGVLTQRSAYLLLVKVTSIYIGFMEVKVGSTEDFTI